MNKDKCLVVDNNDKIVGFTSKLNAHTFSETTSGQLHRAFSVFLFRDDDKMLIQRRAESKITFAGVWSNACCSHQLAGCTPPEIDAAVDISSGEVNGTINAARRKLLHELGIDCTSMNLTSDAFKFLTRVHYCARDEFAEGCWGEHEIDYLLLLRVPSASITVTPNPVGNTHLQHCCLYHILN
jgi:isopentenyl-diphosphate delta-isomerase